MGEVSSVSVNLKANSFKHYLKALIGRQSYYQVIRGELLKKDYRGVYPKNPRVLFYVWNRNRKGVIGQQKRTTEKSYRKDRGFMITASMWTVISKSEENKNFAPKQNERDCPMTVDSYD